MQRPYLRGQGESNSIGREQPGKGNGWVGGGETKRVESHLITHYSYLLCVFFLFPFSFYILEIPIVRLWQYHGYVRKNPTLPRPHAPKALRYHPHTLPRPHAPTPLPFHTHNIACNVGCNCSLRMDGVVNCHRCAPL